MNTMRFPDPQHEIFRDRNELDSDCDCPQCLAGLPSACTPVEMTGETDYIEDYDLAAAIDEMNETAAQLDYSF